MKIAVDCADLDHSRIDGTRVYLKNILNHFGRIDVSDSDGQICGDKDGRIGGDRNGRTRGSSITIEMEDQFYLYHRTDFNSLLKPAIFANYHDRKISYPFWWTQTRLAYEVLKNKADVLWMPIQQLPILVAKKIPSVVTIHDLAFKIFPNFFTRSDRFKLNLFTDYAVKNATKIIAVSQSTKNDILDCYPDINEDKIVVVYHGFDQGLFGQQYTESQINAVFRELRLPEDPYLLYVGAIQPRKDLLTLVRAFEQLKADGFEKLKLYIVGEPAWQADEILNRIHASANREDIMLLGKVNFHDLAVIYQQANIFIMPSIYEGFGMPILEAFAAGVPVVVANNSSLIEIGDQGVQTFATGNADQLAAVLVNLLGDDNLHFEMTAKGKARLADFSWEKCARETLAVIKSCKY